MTAEFVVAMLLIAPLVQALFVVVFSPTPGARDMANIAFALIAAFLAWRMAGLMWAGVSPALSISTPLPGVAFAFAAEPLGASVAVLIASLAALNAIYATGILRALGAKGPGKVLAWVALSCACAFGAALARNLFTFFVCYIALIVISTPPIAQGGARDAARKYFALLLFAAAGLLLPAIVWTHAIAGGLEFRLGGILPSDLPAPEASVLLAAFAFGLAATALFPLHHWVSDAMHAPIPASGLVHSVTLGAIGGLGILKVSLYVFGPAMANAQPAAQALLALSLGGACAAALVALSKDDLKQRFAYSTMAQIGLVTACAMLASPAAAFAGAFAIVAHGLSKLSLFFTAGVVEATTGRTKASELAGLGRRMPWAFAAFAFAALSLAGAPPLAGAWSLVWLVAAAAKAGQIWAIALAVACAGASFAAFGPLAANALFARAPSHPFNRPDAASVFIVVPMALAGLATLLLVFFVNALAQFLGPGLSP